MLETWPVLSVTVVIMPSSINISHCTVLSCSSMSIPRVPELISVKGLLCVRVHLETFMPFICWSNPGKQTDRCMQTSLMDISHQQIFNIVHQLMVLFSTVRHGNLSTQFFAKRVEEPEIKLFRKQEERWSIPITTVVTQLKGGQELGVDVPLYPKVRSQRTMFPNTSDLHSAMFSIS